MRKAKAVAFNGWSRQMTSPPVRLFTFDYTLSPSSWHSPRQEPNLFNSLVVFLLYYVTHSIMHLLTHNSFSKFVGCRKFLSS